MAQRVALTATAECEAALAMLAKEDSEVHCFRKLGCTVLQCADHQAEYDVSAGEPGRRAAVLGV